MDRAQAQRIAEFEIASYAAESGSPELALQDDQTIEKEFGWVFFYQSRKFLETGDFRDMALGNAPLIIDREGNVHETGTAHSIEHYLTEFENKAIK